MRNPLNTMRVTSPYGWRTHPITKKRTFHEGVDLAASVGTPAYAPLAGKVQSKGYGTAPGNYLIIQVDSTTRVRFNHLQHVPAVKGSVREGQVVAQTGNTGDSTGPHLHFAVYRLKGGAWVSTDPLAWLKRADRWVATKTTAVWGTTTGIHGGLLLKKVPKGTHFTTTGKKRGPFVQVLLVSGKLAYVHPKNLRRA